MKYDRVLDKLENNEISSKEALEQLYPMKPSKIGKRAFLVKMKIVVPDEGKGVNTFLRILFAIPFPIIFARIGLRFANRFVKENDVDLNEIGKLLKYSKNTKVQIDAKDALIEIKVV